MASAEGFVSRRSDGPRPGPGATTCRLEPAAAVTHVTHAAAATAAAAAPAGMGDDKNESKLRDGRLIFVCVVLFCFVCFVRGCFTCDQ